MEIIFTTRKTEKCKTTISLETASNLLVLTSEFINYVDEDDISKTKHCMNKEQLHKFIGALLHIQSNLKNDEK